MNRTGRLQQTAGWLMRRGASSWRNRGLAYLTAALLAVPTAGGLEIAETLWNFNGRVVPERFNLLSVRVVNPLATPYDGQLRLTAERGFSAQGGVAVVQPCYVSPRGARWVQFEVYVEHDANVRLTWGTRPDEFQDLPEPSRGAPAQVWLVDPDSLRAPPRSPIRAFPEDLFPPTVAALDGLHSVLLDHVPRWETARRAAFLDWVRGGGVVHLFPDAGGQWPVFRDELAALNTSAPLARLGAGRVVRHPRGDAELQEGHWALQGHGAPDLQQNTNSVSIWQPSRTLLREFGQLNQPQHSWTLIGVLALWYTAAIGPGVFLLGRRRRDYRVALLALGVCVAGFSFLFSYVGRRGQGEASKVRTLAYARALGEDAYLVTQWSDVFVTHGAFYAIRHAAAHNSYAIPPMQEQMQGEVQGGRGGELRLEIPMFSQRGFVHQARLTGPPLAVRAERWPQQGDLRTGKLVVRGALPADTQGLWAVYDNRVWSLTLLDDRLEVTGDGETVEKFFSRENHHSPAYHGRRTAGLPQTPLAEFARQNIYFLLAWGLGSTPALQYRVDDPAQAGRLQVFALAALPPGFQLHSTPRISEQSGYVLYAVDVPPPAGKEAE